MSGDAAFLAGSSDVAPGACLFLHGLGGAPYEMAPLIAALEASGLAVSAPVLPGHEGPGPRMLASAWQDWAAAAETAFDELAAVGKSIVVVGFSTGATLALHLSTRRPVSKLILLAPFMAIRFAHLIPIAPATYLRPLARILPDLPRRPPAVRDPQMRRWVSSQAAFRTFNVPATLSALELIELIKPEVPRIVTPTLIIQGARDTVVEPSGARWLHNHLGSPSKFLVDLKQTDHLVALDYERDHVLSATKSFVLESAAEFEAERARGVQ
jgi:carboxylesterase